MRLALILVGASLVLSAAAAAFTVQYPDPFDPLNPPSWQIPPTKTDWSGKIISLPQFDPSLGVLTGVEVTFYSAVSGTVGVENLADDPSSVDLLLSAVTEFRRGPTLVMTLNPSHAETKSLAAYDGQLDWGGTSGAVYTGFADTKSNVYTPAGPFTEWIGTGTVDFTVLAKATSQTTGSGNIASYYMTNAAAGAVVKYTYIPEPGSVVAFSVGLVGMVGLAARRRYRVGL